MCQHSFAKDQVYKLGPWPRCAFFSTCNCRPQGCHPISAALLCHQFHPGSDPCAGYRTLGTWETLRPTIQETKKRHPPYHPHSLPFIVVLKTSSLQSLPVLPCASGISCTAASPGRDIADNGENCLHLKKTWMNRFVFPNVKIRVDKVAAVYSPNSVPTLKPSHFKSVLPKWCFRRSHQKAGLLMDVQLYSN